MHKVMNGTSGSIGTENTLHRTVLPRMLVELNSSMSGIREVLSSYCNFADGRRCMVRGGAESRWCSERARGGYHSIELAETDSKTPRSRVRRHLLNMLEKYSGLKLSWCDSVTG